jgi:DNA-binding response OmpR family regulator
MVNILIIEDDIQHAEFLKETLKYGGYRPFIANNSDMALKCIQKNSIDFIITDITLPGMSGLDFMHLQQNRGINIPFLVVTGSVDEMDKEIAKNLHSQAYLIKPIDPAELLECLYELRGVKNG